MNKPRELYVTPDWKQWVAENLIRGQDHDELVGILVDAGFPEELCRLEVDVAAGHPYVAAARSISRQLKKRDWVMRTTESLQREYEVERRSGVGTEEFFRDYYAQNRPVILTDCLTDWPALERWNVDYLIDTCGDLNVQIQSGRDGNPAYEVESRNHRTTMTFGKFAWDCFDADDTNDYYMTANNSSANSELLKRLLPDTTPLEQYLDPQQQLGRTFFWLGPTGTVTPLHHDLTNNFMAQVVGRKRVLLISPMSLPRVYNNFHCYSLIDPENPNFEEYPEFRHAHVREVILEPGDLFFLPIGWWHHVRGLETSITLTCTNFLKPNYFNDGYTTYGEI